MIVAPIVAAIIIIMNQFYVLFDRSVRNVAHAHALAMEKIHEWNVRHENDAMRRPCLEEIGEQRVSYSGGAVSIGLGKFKKIFDIPQEVALVEGEICFDK